MRRHLKASLEAPVERDDESRTEARRLAALITVVIAMIVMAVATSPAQAAPGYGPATEFGSELPFFGLFSTGPRIAVDDATGDVLVAPYEPGSLPGVFVYSSSGTLLTQIGAGSIDAGGIAIDQSDGDVYLADASGGRVLRYTTDRANPPTYTVDNDYDGPSQGSTYGTGQIGSLKSALAIDPTNHDLLVADSEGLRVDRYGPDGSFIDAFDGAGTAAGKFSSLLDMAVNGAGDLYVVQNGSVGLESGVFYRGDIRGSSVTRFTPDGSQGSVIVAGGPFDQARAVGVEPSTGRVTVATGGGGGSSAPLELWTLTPTGGFESNLKLNEPVLNSVTAGIAFDPGSGRLYFATGATFNGGTNSVQAFAPREVPGVATGAPGALTPTSARLEGTVTPVGQTTRYHFEYSDDGGANWTSTDVAEIPAGVAPVPISATVALEPAKTYLVRLVAEDDEAGNVTPPLPFASPAAPPLVETGSAVAIEPDRARLQGTVNPLGSQATYYFEYGLTTAYGLREPAGDAVAGKGRVAIVVGHDVTGLQPATVYHYRLVATSAGGQRAGVDRTFETPAVAPPQRQYELVSPLDKGNVGVGKTHTTAFADPGGDAMLFGTEKSTYPGAESAPALPRILAVRTDHGWTDTDLDPPQYGDLPGRETFFGTFAVSADHTRALVGSKVALAPGAIEGQYNLYVRDLQTDTYTLVATGPKLGDGGSLLGGGAEESYVGGSTDLSTVVFVAQGKLVPEAVANENMYAWNEETGLSLVSVAPNGTAMQGETQFAVKFLADPHQVSEDGHRIYFTVQNSVEAGLYLREGDETTLISVSHRPGDSRAPVPATLQAASADGRYVIFEELEVSSGTVPPLTADAPVGEKEAMSYRYDAVTGELTYLASGLEGNIYLPAFPQTGDMFYVKHVGPEGSGVGHRSIVYEHEGVSTVIASEHGHSLEYWKASPNGKYFAFVTGDKLTSYDNQGVEEVYLYDVETEQLTCPSCRTDGRPPTGPAHIGQAAGGRVSGFRHTPRAVLDDGTVFFDTPDPLEADDSNGQRDVYAYRDGEVRLISRGDLFGAAEFVDATPSGSDVFFGTSQQLLPEDKDSITDLYDARIGGGFPEVEPAPQACEEGQCAGGGTARATPPLGSEGVSGTTVASKHRGSPRCVKARHKHGKAGAGCHRKKAKKGHRGSKGHKSRRGSGAKNRDQATKEAGR